MRLFFLIFIASFSGVSISAQTNTAAYDQLISQAGSQIASSNLDAAKQTAQQALQLDGQNWRGNALMAAIFQKQNDFTNAQIYIQKAIATAPADKKDKLNAMAQTIAHSAAQGAPAASGGMSPEARIKYDGLMVIAGDADKATTEDDRKQALREFMAKSAAFLEMEPDATNVWVMRALTAVELDYPCDGWYAGRKLKDLGLDTGNDPKVQKAFGELDAKDWLGENIKWRDWSKWTTDQARAAANAGDEEAQNAMGDWYHAGLSGLPKDETEAAKWREKAAAQGNAFAENNVGWAYFYGMGVAQDYAQALDWYHKSADQGDADAQRTIGWMYQNGKGVTQDYAQALVWYQKSAAQGNADAQNNLAIMYEDGQGVRQDYAQALDWFRKSAAQGLATAQYSLGFMYQFGWGVTQDYAHALDWYRKAAAQGNAGAESILGLMYQNGLGVEKNNAVAKDWFQKAAAQGDQNAKSNLAQLDQLDAFRQKAEQGDATAQDKLGDMYFKGQGIEQDYAQALDWYRKSAAQGNAGAQLGLGLMYQNGWGVEKDFAQAKEWYQKAAAQGNELAKNNLAKLNQSSQ